MQFFDFIPTQMKNFLLLFTIGLLMVSCGTKDMAIDKNNFDTSVDPGMDFYQYSNGGWMKNNPMPPEFSRYGSFDVLAEKSVTMVRSLVENAVTRNSPSGSIDQKVGDFYKAGMDSAKIDSLGISPLKSELAIINASATVEDIKEYIASWHRYGTGMVFAFYGAPDRVNSNMVIANISQGGLGMTDVEYYTSADESAQKMRDEYRKYVTRMFKLAGDDEALANAAIRDCNGYGNPTGKGIHDKAGTKGSV
jgi:putative endopeptidase